MLQTSLVPLEPHWGCHVSSPDSTMPFPGVILAEPPFLPPPPGPLSPYLCCDDLGSLGLLDVADSCWRCLAAELSEPCIALAATFGLSALRQGPLESINTPYALVLARLLLIYLCKVGLPRVKSLTLLSDSGYEG